VASITQIHVRGRLVGIVGLEEALEEARRQGLEHDEAKAFLLGRIRRQNYIPSGLESTYGEALARYYCQRMGLPVPQDRGHDESPPLTIRILGPGCANCTRLEQEVMAVLAELGQPADVLHVTDIKEIASYGVMGTPTLVVNGKVLWVGSVPPRVRLKALLEGASRR
jgi:small redox-active disulfide protein 2